MNQTTVFIFSILMLFTVAIYAQKEPSFSFRWKIAATLPASPGQARALGVAGPVTGITGNFLLVAGGANFPDAMPWEGGRKKYYDEVYLFRQKGKQLVLQSRDVKLPEPLAYAAVCNLPAGIFYGGGETEKGLSSKARILHWQQPQLKLKITELPDLPQALANGAAILYQQKIYLAGGETTSAALAGFYMLDLTDMTSGWQTLPSMPQASSHFVMALQSDGNKDYLYVIGGRKKNENGISDFYRNVFAFDLSAKIWMEKSSLPYAIAAGTGLAAGPRQILLFGGDKGETFRSTETLIVRINRENDSSVKDSLIREKSRLQAAHPGFNRQILVYDSRKDQWNNAGIFPFDLPVTTTALRWKDRIVIPGGEIKAGVRTPAIVMGKLNRINK